MAAVLLSAAVLGPRARRLEARAHKAVAQDLTRAALRAELLAQPGSPVGTAVPALRVKAGTPTEGAQAEGAQAEEAEASATAPERSRRAPASPRPRLRARILAGALH
jgi:hypothetical protein